MRTPGRALCLLLSSTAVGCVLGSEPRPSRSQAMAGPPPDPHEPPSAAGYIARSPGAATESEAVSGKPLPGDRVWVDGYWHWTGVRYAWVEGRWERRRPPYANVR